jgi:hypothetical protein
MLFLDLPLILVSTILSDWIETRELGQLDAAYCNKEYRPHFLSAISHDYTVSMGNPSRDIDDANLTWLMQRRVKVQSLAVSDPDVNLTVQECQTFSKLEYLDIYYRNRLKLISEACAGYLKVLVLRGCEVSIEQSLQMVSQFSALHTLEIGEFTKYMGRRKTKPTVAPNSDLHRAMKCSESLRTFVCNWAGLSPLHVQQIVHACSNLTRLELSVSGLTDETLYTIVQRCAGLTTLKIMRAELTSADGIVALAALRRLESIDLNGSGGVSNDSVIPIISNNPSLRSVGLRSAAPITSLAVMKIAATCPGLTSLDVSYCTFVKDDALTTIANNCRDLQDLQVCGCEFITDMSMLRLANMCNKLTSINIKDCTRVTKITIDAFAFTGVKPYKKKLR